MPLFGFADFDWACRNTPSLPICNLFFRQLLINPPAGVSAPATEWLGLPAASSPDFERALSSYGVGVNSACFIPRMSATGGEPGSLGNVANITLCGLSVIVAVLLVVLTNRRKAAVGRIEMTIFFIGYGLVQGAQLVTTGAFLKAGSTVLTWISAIHLALVVALFWVLFHCALVSLQKFLEDGTVSSIVPLAIGIIILTVGSGYIFVDIGFSVTDYFRVTDNRLHSVWPFVLTIIWPAAAAFIYFVIQIGIVLRVLKETKPLALFSLSALFFILSQGAYYFLSYQMCKGTSQKIDGSFLATLLETVAVIVLYTAWASITEDNWDGVVYMDEM